MKCLSLIAFTLLTAIADCFIVGIMPTSGTGNACRRSSSLGEVCGQNYHTGSQNDVNAPWHRQRGGALSAAASPTISSKEKSTDPLFTFGVLADIQYAPIDDGFSYGGVPRYYRHALQTARHSAQHFESEQLPLVVNLGDIIDGKCQDVPPKENNSNPGRDAIKEVVDALSPFQHGEILHTYGNHELYNVPREELGALLQIPFIKEEGSGELVGYRSHILNGIRFVVVDSYDITLGGRCPQNSAKRKEAEALLSKHNPNFPEQENSPEGLEGPQRRFVAFNGAVGKTQMQWLRNTLEEARANAEKVIVLSHQPIYPDSSNVVCLVWNYEEILDLLREFNCTVIASFAGHAHKGGYRRCEESGIHFRVFEAALESPDPIKTYALIDVHNDRLVVNGHGDCQSASYDFDHIEIARKAKKQQAKDKLAI